MSVALKINSAVVVHHNLMELLTFSLIHIAVPIGGLTGFLYLRHNMLKDQEDNAPTIEWIIVFSAYSVLAVIILTELFWKWSAMASLGTYFLIIIAPIIMIFLAVKNRNRRIESKYRNWLWNASISYLLITPTIFILSLLRTLLNI